MPYLVPLCLLMIAAPVMCAEDATTEQSDNQQRDAINVLKRLKLLKPEAAKSLADSQVLEKAFRKMMVRFAKENGDVPILFGTAVAVAGLGVRSEWWAGMERAIRDLRPTYSTGDAQIRAA